MPAFSLICWHDPAKPKTKRIVEAFAAGCGEAPVRSTDEGWCHAPAVFYGVTPGALPIFREIERQDLRYWYIDNPYFGRGDCFRVTADAKQHRGLDGPQALERFLAFGVPILPWRRRGRHVLVTTQSEWWYRLHDTTLDAWLTETVAALRAATDRPIVVRYKPKAQLTDLPNVASAREVEQAPEGRPLAADLADAWCLVTHSSNTAVEAVLDGVPVFTTSGDCAARSMGSGDLGRVEDPPMPDGRVAWAARLAANQWTLDEIRDGNCWRSLRGRFRSPEAA